MPQYEAPLSSLARYISKAFLSADLASLELVLYCYDSQVR